MRRRGGFTIIELLVVIAIFAVVTSIGTRMFIVIQDGQRTQDLRLALGDTADRALGAIREDVAQVVSAKLGGVAILGEQRLEETKREGRVSLEDDRVTLPVQTHGAPGAPSERQLVTYAIDRSSGARKLVRTVGPLGSKPGEGAALNSYTGVMSMRVEYFDGQNWQHTWKDAQQPQALRVSIVVQSENRPGEQIARMAVFPVRVD